MLSEDVYQRIFVPRAVTREVAETRPYVPYPLNGRHVIYATDPKYRNKMNSSEQWLLRCVLAQQPGIIIAKEPFPNANPVFAQLRPDAPLIFPGSKHKHDLDPNAFHESNSHRKHLTNKDHWLCRGQGTRTSMSARRSTSFRPAKAEQRASMSTQRRT